MTLLDNLSSIPLILPSAYPEALERISKDVSFDQDVKVQVFELTIRALGGLLSTVQLLDSLDPDPVAQARSLGLLPDDGPRDHAGTGTGTGHADGHRKTWWGGKAQSQNPYNAHARDAIKKHTGKKGKYAKGVDVKKYRGRMLGLAYDLGKRLLPAFETSTGLPYARVNLRYGVEKGESVETCESGSNRAYYMMLYYFVGRSGESDTEVAGAAGAGSLILEFAVLSRLTGDDRFEVGPRPKKACSVLRIFTKGSLAHTPQRLASRAYLGIWNRRSPNNLLGNTIGVSHGQWLAPGMSTVGAGVDSYFEYGIKAAILLGVLSVYHAERHLQAQLDIADRADDDTYLDIFHDAYAAIQMHIRTTDGFIVGSHPCLQIST